MITDIFLNAKCKMHAVPPIPGGLGGVTWELSHGVHSILVPDRLVQYSSDHNLHFPDQEMSRAFC